MRILHVTDFHCCQAWFAWLNQQADNYAAVAFTGDLLDQFGRDPIDRQVAWLKPWLRSFPGRLLVCSGNHDTDDRSHSEFLAELAGPRVVVDGQQLTLGRWTFESVGWEGLPTRGGDTQVALAHRPPEQADTAIAAGEYTDRGDFDLHELMARGPEHMRPKLVLSGHVHQPRRWYQRLGRSWSFNPGMGISHKVPNHIVLDLERGIAIWRRENRPDEFVRWAEEGNGAGVSE